MTSLKHVSLNSERRFVLNNIFRISISNILEYKLEFNKLGCLVRSTK